MSDEVTPPFRLQLPPLTADVRKEQIKLGANVFNALAITCFVTGFVGPVITTIPDDELTFGIRLALVGTGAVVHLVGRTYLRYMFS